MTKAIREGLLDLQINESKATKRRSKGLVESSKRKLAEDYEHWAKKNYPNLFGVQSAADGRKNPRADRDVNDRLVALAKLDPTTDQNADGAAILKAQQGPYMQWIIRCVKNSSYDDVMRDAHEYGDQLRAFHDLKTRNRLPADRKDIMQYKTLHDLMDMMQNLGGDFGDGAGEENAPSVVSDFKQELQDIRGLLCRLCRLQDSEIDESVQKWGDVMNYIGGNSKWEIWEAKNYWATMIFDRWGKGAGWCVGGVLGNNWGTAQVRQAKEYFHHYDIGGATYVCFQQTDRNAERPNNKFLITLGPNGARPETSAGYQFNNANNGTQRAEGESGDDAVLEAFGLFLIKEGLWDIFKSSKFSGCELFTIEENKKRLEAGEPFEYYGGAIRAMFKPLIKDIKFTDSRGKERTVSAVDFPAFLNLKSIDAFTVAADLSEGKPYVYLAKAGHTTVEPHEIQPMVREVVIPDEYDYEVPWVAHGPDGARKDVTVVGLPWYALRGCTNLRKVIMSGNVRALCTGWCLLDGSFEKNDTYMDKFDVEVEFHGRKLSTVTNEREWLSRHLKLVPGPVANPNAVASESLSEAVPAAVGKTGGLTAGEDLNSKLLAKIDVLSKALASELERNGFGDSIDPELVRQDMVRDCGLMGGVVSAAELDVERNPFDAETKRMHDEMPVDPRMAAQELLRVSPEEFVGRIIAGLMAERRALAGGRGRLGGPRGGLAGPRPGMIGRR